MKRLTHPWILAAGAVSSISFILVGCGSGPSTEKKTFADSAEVRLNANYRGIRTFAAGLASVNLDVDAKTRELNLTFSEYDLAEVDAQGEPAVSAYVGLTGKLVPGGESELVAHGSGVAEPNYRAVARCADAVCRAADIEIEKISGPRAGRALVHQEIFSSTRVRAGAGGERPDKKSGTPATPNVNPRELAQAIRDYDHEVTLAIDVVQDGRTFFVVELAFSNDGLSPASRDYFVEKRAYLTGNTGKHQRLQSSMNTLMDGGIATGGAEEQRVDATYDAAKKVLYIDFKKDEGLTALTAGPGA